MSWTVTYILISLYQSINLSIYQSIYLPIYIYMYMFIYIGQEVGFVDGVCWHMLSYADVCWRMLVYADVWWRMLTYADVWWRMMIYVYIYRTRGRFVDVQGATGRYGVCWRMLTYADVWWHMFVDGQDATARYHVCWRLLTYDDVWWRMLTYASSTAKASQQGLYRWQYCYICVLILLHMCPHTPIYYIYVLLLPYMSTVSLYYYTCPHVTHTHTHKRTHQTVHILSLLT
jgi:hypothetical protein